MKRTLLLISAALLSAMAWGQKLTLYLSGNQTYEYDISQVDSIVFSDASTVEPEEIVVSVDASGNADGGHQFSRIDETTFLIDGLKYKYENGGLTVIGYDEVFFTGVAKIISKLIYNGRTINVLGIGDGAFTGCSSLASIIIPNGVTQIGNSAFRYCDSLTSVTIPESVTSVFWGAFDGCSSLTSVHISDLEAWCKIEFTGSNSNPLTFAHHLYLNGSEIKDLVIPNSVTYIGSHAFSGCIGLTSITIPESVTSIGIEAFMGCTGLTSITIPNSVTTIWNSAFSGCI